MTEILVIGSANLDISVPVDHLPQPGETVLGGDALWSPGGKGANQAVAAARLGRRVGFLGFIGGDPAGKQLLDSLEEAGVEFLGRVLPETPTGLALISVSADGENLITVSPGTNARLGGGDVHRVLARIAPSVILAQFEVPLSAVVAAGSSGSRLVVNPAPAQGPSADLDRVMEEASIVVPNRVELAQLAAASPADSIDDIVDQARSLPVDAVVVTLGPDGALVVDGGAVEQIPPIRVDVVDTTAAGDAFCGGLADGLASGASVPEAARWATRVAAVAVTRRGAQASLGTRDDVLAVG